MAEFMTDCKASALDPAAGVDQNDAALLAVIRYQRPFERRRLQQLNLAYANGGCNFFHRHWRLNVTKLLHYRLCNRKRVPQISSAARFSTPKLTKQLNQEIAAVNEEHCSLTAAREIHRMHSNF
jgi:hypothetical protein